ncbi:MAG TPA: GFA family protein [Gammaproteobacteria bacterium]
MKTTHRGSCHCEAVRFECELDTGIATRKCNCSWCSKTRFWKVFVPAGGFRLLQGESELAEYRFGTGIAGHRFCRRCGVNLFLRIDLGDAEPGHVVNLACLDGEPSLRDAFDVIYEDGRNDNWWASPARTQHL